MQKLPCAVLVALDTSAGGSDAIQLWFSVAREPRAISFSPPVVSERVARSTSCRVGHRPLSGVFHDSRNPRLPTLVPVERPSPPSPPTDGRIDAGRFGRRRAQHGPALSGLLYSYSDRACRVKSCVIQFCVIKAARSREQLARPNSSAGQPQQAPADSLS